MVCTAANAGSLCRWDVKIFSKLFQSGRARVGVSKSTQLFVTATNSKRPNGEHRTTKAAMFKITVPQNTERNSALADLCRRNCCASKAPGQPPAICELPSRKSKLTNRVRSDLGRDSLRLRRPCELPS